MTTRANITVMEDGDIMIFYQHSDGYPEGVMPMLRWFVDSMRVGAIRRDIELASGWLVRTSAEIHETCRGISWLKLNAQDARKSSDS